MCACGEGGRCLCCCGSGFGRRISCVPERERREIQTERAEGRGWMVGVERKSRETTRDFPAISKVTGRVTDWQIFFINICILTMARVIFIHIMQRKTFHWLNYVNIYKKASEYNTSYCSSIIKQHNTILNPLFQFTYLSVICLIIM